MITGFEDGAKFEFFGRTRSRDPAECPHCGKQGNKMDEGLLLWNERPKAMDYEYVCATCGGEWLIRVFRYTGYEKYPGPHSAVIYIPAASVDDWDEADDQMGPKFVGREPDIPF